MKKYWMFITILPIAGFCHCCNDDLFHLTEQSEEPLCHLEYDQESCCGHKEDFDFEDFNKEGFSLLEIDESDASLIPWDASDLASDEEFSHFIEQRASEINEKSEDVFAYDLPTYQEDARYIPTFEKVPEHKRQLIGSRPKVVQSRPDSQEETPKSAMRPPITRQKEGKETSSEKTVYKH